MSQLYSSPQLRSSKPHFVRMRPIFDHVNQLTQHEISSFLQPNNLRYQNRDKLLRNVAPLDEILRFYEMPEIRYRFLAHLGIHPDDKSVNNVFNVLELHRELLYMSLEFVRN
ncbi:hypothetical protein BCV70DRAFT_235047 [Testicularia cyperi]|uniref:Uncharacterized protein n=1 Tax=Testicularia cyperi TaxID=1882483 RepID=A0A317XYH3_9BASI|nr:hypothetical protein BCV70DRAFT_235047 [Testicularia cyperi]